MTNLYATDYGDVRVSDQEMTILRSAEMADQFGVAAQSERLMSLAAAIIAACDRVALWKRAHGL